MARTANWAPNTPTRSPAVKTAATSRPGRSTSMRNPIVSHGPVPQATACGT